jgi:transcriptional regulator GlxA family with amidase domain
MARPELDAVQKYMTQNSHRQVSVLQLAQMAGLSCGYFSRVFRISTGSSPHAFLVACRLKHAVDLLKLPHMKLAEIALECGFADQAHFCRRFLRSTGWTPAAWRRHFGQIDFGDS